MQLLLASTNAHKIKEYKSLLKPYGIVLKSLLDYPDITEIEEPYDSFEKNALIKAQTISDILNIPVISDDSGLCVDALAGAPGVKSARWSGVHRDYDNLNKKLLDIMSKETNRSAHYNTTIALVIPGEQHHIFVGIMPLTVATKLSTTKGFSYDEVVKYNDTYVSEMSLEEKNKISSRAHALNQLINYLRKR